MPSPRKIRAEDAAVLKRIGASLRQLREARGMTRQAVADEIGVTHQMVAKYEKGQGRIDAARVLRLAKLYGCSVPRVYS